MDKTKEEIIQQIGIRRFNHMMKMRELAVKHNRCKEMRDVHCIYPHCGCLYGENGHIDPITGKEYK